MKVYISSNVTREERVQRSLALCVTRGMFTRDVGRVRGTRGRSIVPANCTLEIQHERKKHASASVLALNFTVAHRARRRISRWGEKRVEVHTVDRPPRDIRDSKSNPFTVARVNGIPFDL